MAERRGASDEASGICVRLGLSKNVLKQPLMQKWLLIAAPEDDTKSADHEGPYERQATSPGALLRMKPNLSREPLYITKIANCQTTT